MTTAVKVPREKVFDAWLTADRMARFLCAGDTHVASEEVDPRVGGAFRIIMANAQGSYDHRGRYLEIERPARLRFTWTSTATNGNDTDYRHVQGRHGRHTSDTRSRGPAGRARRRATPTRVAEHSDQVPG